MPHKSPVRGIPPYLINLSGGAFACLLAPGVALAQLCGAGSYSATGSAPCVQAQPGYYVPVAGATSETPAPAGSYVAGSGATAPTPADPGYYVANPASSAETPAPAGSYVAGSGATAPTLAVPGYFVANPGSSAQTPAPAGSYVPSSGATAPTLAVPGYYVANPGSSAQTPAPVGSYVPSSGATAPTLAMPGYYVQNLAANAEAPAPFGTYVPGSGAATSIPCPGGVGGSFAYGGASVCRAGTDTTGTVSPAFTAIPPAGGVIDFGTIPSNTTAQMTIAISNDVVDPGNQADLTDLTLLDGNFSGPQAGAFGLPGFVDGTVIEANDEYLLQVDFSPLMAGGYTGTLTIGTDQFASLGDPGESFTFTAEGQALPEPGGLALLTLTPMLLRSRVWRRRKQGQDSRRDQS